jgi:integrase
MQGLYKRGEVWWLRYAGPDGKSRFESSKSSSFKDAHALLIARKKEVMEGRDPVAAKRVVRHTFRELAQQYLPWAERQRS